MEIKADPRRKFCEHLTWAYTSEYEEVCTLLDKSTSNCYGNYDLKLKPIGYIPTLCPQFPCKDFHYLKSGISQSPHNQIVHLQRPTDTSGTNINISSFDSNILGYIRTAHDNQSYHNSNQCPSNMYGISYYWNNRRQKSCTILSQQQSKQTIEYSLSDIQFLQQHCRDNTNETFLGCIYTSHESCISALENPEYVDIVEPTKLRVSINIYIESVLKGSKERTLSQNQQTIDDIMANANSEDDTEFTISSKINIAEFSIGFGDISNNFRICTDELFNLQQFIPGLNPSTTLKFCLRATNWRTFMPKNGELYVKFLPYFTAIIRKESSMSSLGFSGGIEYKANPFISHLSLIQPTNWLNKPDKDAVVREDLKWYKPLIIHKRNEYTKPPDFSMIALAVFLVIMGIYYVLMFKNYINLRREEKILERHDEERMHEQEEQERLHKEWERAVIEKDKEYKGKMKLNEFIMRKSEELLGDKGLRDRLSEIEDANKIRLSVNDEIRKTKLEQYSDIPLSDGELNRLVNASVPSVPSSDISDDGIK